MMAGSAARVALPGRKGLWLLALFLTTVIFAAPAAQGAELRLRVVESESGATTAYVDPETGRYVLAPPTGHVEAEYGQRSLAARRAEYDRETGTLVLAGDVRLQEPGMVARAARLTADLTAEEYRLEGQARIERVREGRESSVLTAHRVIYRPGDGEVLASGGVRLEEGSRWFRAESARLWDGLALLDLSGNVAGDWREWAVERADRVQVELESGAVTLFGPAEILFQVADPAPEGPVAPGS